MSDVDLKTLERLAAQLRKDALTFHGLNPSAMNSVAAIIEDSIGAPISWPSRVAGVQFADEAYPGSPTHRAVFNHGVKWAVEHYSPTTPVRSRTSP